MNDKSFGVHLRAAIVLPPSAIAGLCVFHFTREPSLGSARTSLHSGARKIPEIEKRRSETGPPNRAGKRLNPPLNGREDAFRRRKPLSAPAVAEPPKPAEAQFEGNVTKQERMLTLLSRKEGASIAEMMQATKWQQHSVRGFLAGTVKKKLGFQLTSSKEKDGARRDDIATRHGR